MHVVVLHNPKSGRGKAEGRAARLGVRLERAGFTISQVAASNGDTAGALRPHLSGAGALVIVGGDGTVHSAAGAAAELGVPVYHVPLGTENLFAREFGMDGDTDRLIAALRAGRVERIDLGTMNGKPFVLMASAGPDASVIHRLERRRTGAVTHMSYAVPVLAELWKPALRRMSVFCDGTRLVDGETGLLVVANSRQYALRLDPAHEASMTDAMLDVVFMPARSRLGLLAWCVRSRLRRLERRDAFRSLRAGEVVIRWEEEPGPVQVDGEAAKSQGLPKNGEIHLGVLAGALGVLRPA